MLLIIPSLIVGLGTGLGTGISAAKANKRGVKAAKELQRRQFEFQRDMSNTAVSRYADDLDRSGFNRILAAKGALASTPSGSSPGIPSLRSAAGEGISTALAAREQVGRIKLIAEQGRHAGSLADKETFDNVQRKLKADLISTARDKAEGVKDKGLDFLKSLQNKMTGQPKPRHNNDPYGKQYQTQKYKNNQTRNKTRDYSPRGVHGSGSSGGTER